MKSKYKPAERDPLVKAGLLALEPPQARSQRLKPTDKAWAWVIDHPQIPLSNRPTQQEHTLKRLIETVGAYLTAHNIPLIEFLASSREPVAPVLPVTPPKPEPTPTPSRQDDDLEEDDLEAQIRAACLEITGGQFKVRVLLADLRQHLSEVPRQSLDAALNAMELAQKLALMPLDDPQAIRPADQQAAIVVGGEPRHILYLEP